MGSLLRIAAASLRLGALSQSIAAVRRRVIMLAVVGVIAAVGALAMLAWFSIALYLYCASQIGEPLAALVAGGAFLVIVLLALLIASFSRPRAAPPPPQTATFAAALSELETFLRNNKNSLLLVAVVAGLVLGTGRSRR